MEKVIQFLKKLNLSEKFKQISLKTKLIAIASAIATVLVLIFVFPWLPKNDEPQNDATATIASPMPTEESPTSPTPSPTPTPTPAPTPIPPEQIRQPQFKTELTSVYNQPEKIAYLTFDDGPTANITPQILDILKEKNVKATFFVLGVNVVKNPDIAKRAVAEGHVLANHSYSHDYKKIYNGTESFLEDLKKTEAVILETVGEEGFVKVYRFPGGSFEAKKNPQKDALHEVGYYYLDWNTLNGDAEGHNIPAKTLVDNVRTRTQGKRNAVILLHDAATKQTTVDSLAEIIDYLTSEGYTFKTLKDVPLS